MLLNGRDTVGIDGDVHRKIASAPLRTRPFPYLAVPNLLSRNLVAALRQNWPSEAVFEPYSDGHDRSHDDPGRFGFYIMGNTARDRAKGLTPELRDFWKQFAAGPVKELMNGLYWRLFPGVEARFGGALNKLAFETFAVLVNCNRELDVPVHTDQPAFVVSALIYIDDLSAHDGGTSIYTPLTPTYEHPGTPFLDPSHFQKFETVPFRAGTALGMLCTDNSFHGVERVPVSVDRPRRTINIHVRLTDEAIECLYGQNNVEGFRYPITADKEALEQLGNWRRLEEFGGAPVDARARRPMESSFLYGTEIL